MVNSQMNVIYWRFVTCLFAQQFARWSRELNYEHVMSELL